MLAQEISLVGAHTQTHSCIQIYLGNSACTRLEKHFFNIQHGLMEPDTKKLTEWEVTQPWDVRFAKENPNTDLFS